MKNARQIALEALNKTENDGYSSIVLDNLLEKSEIDGREKAFASALFYGVLERQQTIDYQLARFLKSPLKKTDKRLLNILRLGAYQLYFLNSVPDNAAVNESVNLAKKSGKSYFSGLVNAILRNIIRDDKKICYPNKSNIEKYFSVYYSCPEELVSHFIKTLGKERAEKHLAKTLGKPPVFIRVNTTKIDKTLLSQKLVSHGIEVLETPLENALEINLVGSVETLEEYKNGLFHVQDLSSQICAKVLDAKPNMSVLDVCGAPGGKTFTIAEYMENRGEIICCDIHESRLKLVNQGAQRLSLTNIKTMQNDSQIKNPNFTEFDRVLCDVPCSGFGIIRRKPEIKQKSIESIKSLYDVQKNILQTSSSYLKIGGILVYSTCTINPNENENQVREFLEQNKNFKLLPISDILKCDVLEDAEMLTLSSEMINSDGFFIAKLQRMW